MLVPARRALTTPVTVEFEDVDALGMAHHAAIVRYLERARMRLVAGVGLALAAPAALPVLHELNVRFQQPLRLLDEVEVAVWVASYDDYVLRLEYRIRRGGRSVARASTGVAFADRETGRLVPAPPEMLAFAARALEAT